jgi:uncharacterized protein (DUF1501 family)
MVATDRKTLVCLFLNGGCDTVNVLVPWETTRYNAYALSRGAFGTRAAWRSTGTRCCNLPRPPPTSACTRPV